MIMNKPKSKGLGDTLEKLIKTFKLVKTVGKKDCGSCKARKEKLNKLFPYSNLTI